MHIVEFGVVPAISLPHTAHKRKLSDGMHSAHMSFLIVLLLVGQTHTATIHLHPTQQVMPTHMGDQLACYLLKLCIMASRK